MPLVKVKTRASVWSFIGIKIQVPSQAPTDDDVTLFPLEQGLADPPAFNPPVSRFVFVFLHLGGTRHGTAEERNTLCSRSSLTARGFSRPSLSQGKVVDLSCRRYFWQGSEGDTESVAAEDG